MQNRCAPWIVKESPTAVRTRGIRLLRRHDGSLTRRFGPGFRCRCVGAGWLLCWLLAGLPAETAVAGSDAVPGVTADAADSKDEDAEDRRGQRVMLGVSFMAITAIVLAGLGLVVFTMSWGRRLRRHLRRSDPRSVDVDPLWYLQSTGGPAKNDEGDSEESE